jgi:hypothetical protein
MAKSSTTHVIEIESGIGEPAFIPLTLGQELHPISLGKKGMWRIESARVLEVHAFVYFDGTSLFIQSADESAAAFVDGYRVGKAWTELHPPCKIEIGAARLRFRSLSDPASDRDPMETQRRPLEGVARDSRAPRTSRIAQEEEPLASPKNERPFKPGELSSAPPPNEPPRAPPMSLRSGGGGTVVTARSDDPASRSSADDSRLGRAGARAAHDPPEPDAPGTTPTTPDMTLAMGRGRAVMPPGVPMQPGMAIPPGMPMQPGPYAQAYPGPPAQGGMPNVGYGSVTGGQTGGPPSPPERSIPYYLAKYKELSGVQRLLLILAPFSLLAAAYLLLFDDAAEPPTRVASQLDAGAEAAVAVTTKVPTTGLPPPLSAPLSATPTTPSCPAGFVPYNVAINGQIACVPAGTPMPPVTGGATTTPNTPSSAPGPGPMPPAPAPAPTVAATKSLERQAVDYVASGDYAAAAKIYEQLHQQNPNNRVYAEASRILRAKADAGMP